MLGNKWTFLAAPANRFQSIDQAKVIPNATRRVFCDFENGNTREEHSESTFAGHRNPLIRERLAKIREEEAKEWLASRREKTDCRPK